jgi:stage II sporulation protein E
MVNRDRMSVAGRLSSVSEVFMDLAEQLDKEDESNPYTAKRLAKEVAKNYCGRCVERNVCFSALGSDTAEVLMPLADAVTSRGKTTILDVPPFLSSRCVKLHNLLSVVNNAGEAYKTKSALGKEIFNCKKVMSEQFAGMSLILDSLSEEYSKNITFGGDDEERLENELMKHNIVASETVIAGKGATSRVALTVREVDVNKTMLVKTVSQCLKNPYAVNKVTDRGDEKTVHLVCAPTFDVAYGVAEKRRDGEMVSGDSKAVLSPSLNKKIFAIADGMGSGQRASLASVRSLNMIENFYRAGFEDGLILSMVNQLLCLVSDEDFSALDIAVIDTADGGLDVIKLGASSGFILRKDAVEVLKSNAPPVGIVDKINPTTSRLQLYDGDMVVMASDGVVDALGEKGVVGVVGEVNTQNPQTLADKILLSALGEGASDDCTVMVMRLTAI